MQLEAKQAKDARIEQKNSSLMNIYGAVNAIPRKKTLEGKNKCFRDSQPSLPGCCRSRSPMTSSTQIRSEPEA